MSVHKSSCSARHLFQKSDSMCQVDRCADRSSDQCDELINASMDWSVHRINRSMLQTHPSMFPIDWGCKSSINAIGSMCWLDTPNRQIDVLNRLFMCFQSIQHSNDHFELLKQMARNMLTYGSSTTASQVSNSVLSYNIACGSIYRSWRI